MDPTSFTFEVDNFWEKDAMISSPKFSSGGCEWHLNVYPKGKNTEDHFSLFLRVANPESLGLGWKRRASFSFVLLNQSGKEILRRKLVQIVLRSLPRMGFSKRLKDLREKGSLEKNKLIVQVKVKVLEAVDEAEVTGKEMTSINGFHVLYSQVCSVNALFTKHRGFAENFKPKSQSVRTSYMNILLTLIETLNKHPHSLSETELTKASSELIDLTEAGFKLDWLKTKLNEVTLERKKGYDDSRRVQELEEQVKNLKAELNEEKKKSATHVAEDILMAITLLDTIELNKKRKLIPE